MLTSKKIFDKVSDSKGFLPFLILLGVILLVLRNPNSLFIEQPMKIEDVDVLLQEAIRYSWGSLFVVYNSYFHFVPRLVTIISLYSFGITNAIHAMNLFAIVIATLCAFFFATKQFRFIIKSDLLRTVCSFFIILVPGVDEVYSNISNIQLFLNIFLMLFTILLLFRYDEYQKKSKKEQYLYTFFCSLSFLSSAFSIVLLPGLVYVIIREFKRNRKEIITKLSYIIPTILLFSQTIILYVSFSQQFRSSSLHISEDIVKTAINGFTISIIKIFYYNNNAVFQYTGVLMYLIPLMLITFFLINSIKNGLKLEMYVLASMMATLFFSSIIRHDNLDWQCLCGGSEERYFFFTIVFSFILLIRQFDKKKSLFFKLIFSSIGLVIILNIISGFFILSSADENWKYVTKLYDSTGAYQCYVAEVPHGWAITIPCSKPISNNTTKSGGILSSEYGGPSITFTPPTQTTTTTITSDSSSVKFGQSITFTATVSPIPDYGAIQFYIDGKATGKPLPIYGGQSTFSESLPVGLHQIYASFLGAPNFNPSISGNLTTIVLSNTES